MKSEINQKKYEVDNLNLNKSFKQDYKRKNRFFEFITDLITGFGALIVIGLMLFIVIPVLLIVLKIGAVLIVPISLLGAFIIIVALLGKFIRHIFTKRSLDK